ncbi:RNA-dependent RNA polymerase [Bandia virus]|uniref:RNA-directed RNA polymerase L n=2 Tax=Bandia virus TaxID=248060 RepID=A0A191KW77_9VIRU|nr:RNA-dependent RNA polymerase [Bandia virus]
MATILDSLSWDEVYEGYSQANTVFSYREFFEKKQTLPDGNCFFRAVSAFLYDTQNGWNEVKSICREYAKAKWDTLIDLPTRYQNPDHYCRDQLPDGYWGGSVEAEILSKALNISIVFWRCDDDVWVTNACKWGQGDFRTSINLLHLRQDHFDYLVPVDKSANLPENKMSLLDKITFTVDSILPLEEVENHDILADDANPGPVVSDFKKKLDDDLRSLSDLKKDIFTKRNINKEAFKPDIKNEKDFRKVVAEGRLIPLRVGKVLNNLFCSTIEAILEEEVIMLYPKEVGRLRFRAFDINTLGHKIIDGKKKYHRSFGSCAVAISKDLMGNLDAGYLLRMCFPGTGLSQTPDLVHPEILFDLAITATSVLLSTFLYKAKLKTKRNFIKAACSKCAYDVKKLQKLLCDETTKKLYNEPYRVVQRISQTMFKQEQKAVSEALRMMNPQSKLAFQCIELESLSLQTYFKLLKELKENDNQDQNFSSTEVKDLHECVNVIQLLCETDYSIDEKKKITLDFCTNLPTRYKSKRTTLRDLVGLCIMHFFRSKMIFKFVSLQGKAYAGMSLENLLAYAYNLYQSKENLKFTPEDTEQLCIDMRKLNNLLSSTVKKPVAIICSELYKQFRDMMDMLPEDCKQECTTLFDDIRNADSHASAWKSALRLKGTAYEGFFSKTHNWDYVPEDLKPSLSMAIQTLFPEKFEAFLERTHTHPEYRDFIPDFFLCKPRILKRDTVPSPPVKNHVEQLEDDNKQQDEPSLARKTTKKRFPLPEVAVQEVRSVRAIMDNFEQWAKDKKRPLKLGGVKKDEEDVEENELLIIEVGYQTDVEGKVVSDMNKWKGVLNLMRYLNIQVNVVTCADTSSTPKSDWWIKEEYVKLLLSSISYLFKQLQENSPSDVTDIAVGNISTQKIRSVIRSGTTIKTPVTLKEVSEAWKESKDWIMERPTGVKLPKQIEEALEVAMVEGAVVSKQSAESCFSFLLDNMDTIINEFEKTKYKHEVNKEDVTAEKIQFGWMSEDLNASHCESCLKAIKTSLNSATLGPDKIAIAARALHPADCSECCTIRLPEYPQSSYQRRLPTISEVSHLETSIDDYTEGAILDRLVKLTLPGKTEKERKIKRGVEQLIRASMKHSKLHAVKLPNGQLILDSKLKSDLDKNALDKMSFKEGGLKTLEEDRDHFSKILSQSKLQGYSDYVKETLQMAIEGMATSRSAKCSLPENWIFNILQDLKVDTGDEVILNKIQDSYQKKADFEIKPDKFVPVEWEKLENYLQDKFCKLEPMKAPLFKLDCLLFQEVYFELNKKLIETPYNQCPKTIASLLKLLLNFQWFNEAVYYAKTCETFLQAVSEFNRSGIKIIRVRHTNTNLVVVLPANKKQNMRCCLYDSKFQLLKGPFIMNRRQAVLGAAYPYITTICLLQCLQHYRCSGEILKHNEDVVIKIIDHSMALKKETIDMLKEMHNGNVHNASSILTKRCILSGNFLNKSSQDHFITVVAGFNITMGVLLGDSILNNSQPFNKQIQMMRQGLLCSLSKLSCPSELGKKFSVSCRKPEFHISRLYMQLIVFTANKYVEYNTHNWLKSDLCPKTRIPCFTIFGTHVNSDRQLIFDIYLVHIYNKEMDDFEEGCIKVLEETAERHMTWEKDIERACRLVDRGGEEAKEGLRDIRLLMGLPNIKRIKEDESCSSESSDIDSFSMEDGPLEQPTSSVKKPSSKKARSFSKLKQPPTSMYGIRAMKSKPLSVSDSFEVLRDDTRDYQQAMVDTGIHHTYKVNNESVLKDIIRVIRKNPSHTFGSVELVQVCTEIARTKFPPESLEKARRDQKNWISVSEVTETTSIIAEPRDQIMIKDAYQIILGSENKKLVKLFRGKLQRIGMSCKIDQKGKVKCADLLDTVTGLTAKQKKDITIGLTEPSKLTFYSWKDLIKKNINEVLLTADGNYIYCWLKSMASNVKKSLKNEIKGLKYGTAGLKSRLTEKSNVVAKEELLAIKSFIEYLKECTISGVAKDTNPGFAVENMITGWVKFTEHVKDSNFIIKDGLHSLEKLSKVLPVLQSKFEKICKLKKELPEVSFSREELELKMDEKNLIASFGQDIMKVSNLLFLACLSCPWCIHYKTFEAIMMKSMADVDNFNMPKSSTGFNELHPDNMIKLLCIKHLTPIAPAEIEIVTKYCMCLFSINELPYTSALTRHGAMEYKGPSEQLMGRIKSIMAITGLTDSRSDFKWTINLIANSNFEVSKKLTGRSIGERLPRSVRSKVIYEIIKLVGDTEMAVLQQLAFTSILNPKHRFFAVLAPKAQLGGHRDLLVQETGTKLVHAASEMFSRTILGTTKDDGLTNSHLKETILNTGLEAISQMKISHGREVADSSELVQFYKVCCVSGDNTKWGPIHCCSIFSGMMQQLLKDYDDWSSFYKLTFLKNLCRQVEIPASSIKKLLNSFRYKNTDINVDELSETELRTALSLRLSTWKGNEIMQFLVKNYVSKGMMAMNSYNHMGQGIHHATSSVLTSVMAEVNEHLINHYFKKHLPDLQVITHHAGSSDDYAKCIIATGVLTKSKLKEYEENFWTHMCRLKNFLAGFNRACQMKDSAKTLVSDCFLEFYSEFMMSQRITPAVIKFILTGLINSSVTSPLSLVQACHVSSQQALFNSVPLITNICFTVFRQQMFFNHTEYFQRNYGMLTMGSLSSFGKLFIPIYSNLISSSTALEDAEEIVKACNVVNKTLIHLPPSTKAKPEFITDRRSEAADIPNKVDQESSSATEETSSISSTPSDSSGASFHFNINRVLTNDEESYTKTIDNDLDLEVLDVCLTQTKAMYIGHHDYKDMPIWEKLRKCGICTTSAFLSNISDTKDLLKILRVIRSVLILLITGYYRTFTSEGTEKSVKAALNRDENRIVEDPMIQLLPEKLRRELARLGLSRMEVKELVPKPGSSDTLSSLVARKLVTMNCATEDYKSEILRLKQTLSSRNVLHGLAGGIKELSLPIYTIFMKSYFFKDLVFLTHHDKWNTKHSTNYRDSTGQTLDNKVVVKYVTWLDRLLSSTLSTDYVTPHSSDSLFDESLKGAHIIHCSDKSTEISLLKSEIEIISKEMRNLAIQFSDINRQKIKVVESHPAKIELEANKAVIVKSGLFSATDQVRLSNNPALIVGNLLDESVIVEAKPAKIDTGSLGRDRFKLTQFYTSLIDLINCINNLSLEQKKLGVPIDLELVNKYANNLTLLCRLVQQTRNKLTNFYMIKGSHINNEPTINELISYGIIEGKYYELTESSIDVSSYSLKYWKIMQCISAISVLPIPDSSKTSLLNSFLNWKPDTKELCNSCPFNNREKQMLQEFNGRLLINILASELPNIRNEQQRKNIEDLTDFVNSPMELLRKRPYLGTTSTFHTWGEGQKDGAHFTYSSSSGEATGIFIGTKLHIYISKEANTLLLEVEKKVLEWLNHRRTDILTKEQHAYFLDLLPEFRHIPKRGSDGKALGLRYSRMDPKLFEFTKPNSSSKVVKFKREILSVKKKLTKDIVSEPRAIWGTNSLTIIYDEQVERSLYHQDLLNVKETLDTVLNPNADRLPNSAYADTRLVLSKIRFSPDLFLKSLIILHHFIEHTPNTAIWEAQSKSNIIEYLMSSPSKTQMQLVSDQISKATANSISDNILSDFDSEEQLCRRLSEAVDRKMLPISAWPEVQSYLDDTGHHNITLNFLQMGLSDNYSWKFTRVIDSSSIPRAVGLRGVINLIGSEAIPRFMSPLIADGRILSQAIKVFTEARNMLAASGISDRTIDACTCSIIFCCQNKEIVRLGYRFSLKCLLMLATEKKFSTLDDLIQVSFNTLEEEVLLNLKVNIVRPSELKLGKEDRAGLSRARLLTAYNLIFPNITSMAELKKNIRRGHPDPVSELGEFMNLEFGKKESENCINLNLTRACSDIYSLKENTIKCISRVINFLAGYEDVGPTESYETIDPANFSHDQITLLDLLDEAQTVEQDYLPIPQPGNISFDWSYLED